MSKQQPNDQPHDQSVRERAYALWEAQGRPAGKDQEHWEQARREIEDLQQDSGDPLQQAAKPGKPRRASPAKTGSAAGTGSSAKGRSTKADAAPAAKRAKAAPPPAEAQATPDAAAAAPRGRKKKSEAGTSSTR